MITKFEAGKWYVCDLKERPKKCPKNWNQDGEMDFLLDGKPHLCSEADGVFASFPDSPDPKWMWSFYLYMNHFTKVPAPNEEQNNA